jgi:Fe(3+) dicitrate transport protein
MWAQDQDTTLHSNPVVIIGKAMHRVPGSGEYFDTKRLARFNQSDINKVLRLIPGVQIRDEEGFGLRPNIGLRGTSVNRCAKITLMEDGVLVAPAPYADPSAYYFPTFDRMEGVEILKGSSQIKYGPNTVGGAINLLSRKIPNQFNGQFYAGYGHFGTNKQGVWIGNSDRNVDYVFDFGRMASNGFKQLDNGEKTGFDRRDFLAKIRFHNAADKKNQQSLTLKVLHMSEDGKESYLGLTYDDFQKSPYRRYAATQKDLLTLSHEDLNATYNGTFFKKFQVAATGYYSQTSRDWSRVNKVGGVSLNSVLNEPNLYAQAFGVMQGDSNGVVVFQSAMRTYYSKGIQSAIRYTNKWNETGLEWEVGLRYHQDAADRFATNSDYQMIDGWMQPTSMGIVGNAENQIRQATSLAMYTQAEFNYRRLTLNPGLRYEKINLELTNFGLSNPIRSNNASIQAQNEITVLAPGIGFTVTVLNSMSVFGGLHKGFSPPGTPLADNANGQANVESALNYELGYRLRNGHIKAQIVGFYCDYTNILGSDNVSSGGAGTGNVFNAGNAEVYGCEANADMNVFGFWPKLASHRLDLRLGYTYSKALFGETFVNAGGDWGSGLIHKRDIIPFITPHLFSSTITYSYGKMELTAVGRYVGTTRIKPGQGTILTPSDDTTSNSVNAIEQNFIVDLSANYTLTKNWSLFGLVNNLLNEKYIVANLPQGYRPGMPFSILGGFKYIIK